MNDRILVLGTRGSALALRQAFFVRDALSRNGGQIVLEEIKTTGDQILDVPLSRIGDKALFTKELDMALLQGRIQLAVHSLKDLPTILPPGIALAAVTHRKDPRDAFVAHPSFKGGLADLPEGSVIGTSSLRREAQLRAWRSDVNVVPVRGNVDTRLGKLDSSEWHGMVLAVAGLERLGFEHRVREVIGTGIMLPAVGQGALAVVCAQEDSTTLAFVRTVLHDTETASGVEAERAFLRRLEGGCSVPVGAFGRTRGGRLVLDGCVVSLDGRRSFRDSREGDPDDAQRLGTELAETLLDAGAAEILDEIRGGSSRSPS